MVPKVLIGVVLILVLAGAGTLAVSYRHAGPWLGAPEAPSQVAPADGCQQFEASPCCSQPPACNQAPTCEKPDCDAK